LTTASESVAVIATQVAKTDRRALSEAWYSALHLAHAPAPLARAGARGALPALTPVPARRVQSALPAGTQRQMPLQVCRAARAATVLPQAPPDRRHVPSATARTIERAVAKLGSRTSGPAAQTIDVAGGRVRLLVRSNGVTTRIIAVCSAPLRESVERALAHARFTLAGNGIAAGPS
jgi:hypothetical protein